MNEKIKYIIILITLLGSNLFSQDNLKIQFDSAANLYNSGQYYDAVTEFKRLLFFDHEKIYAYSANQYVGLSYKMGAKFSDAILHFTVAEMNASNRDDLFNSKIEIIRANILRRTSAHAIALLDSLQKDGRFKNKSPQIFYWEGWAYIFDDKWDEAAKEFSKTDSNKALAQFCKNIDEKKYSETFANIASHFIPGSGQIYTGHYFSGFLSLGWNVLWGYLTINSFVADRIFDGLVVGNFLWLRFYNGNLQNAVKFTDEENLKITNEALNYLQTGYQGTKP